LVAGVSLAFSPDLIAEYNLQPLQSVTVTLANGQTITGQYADKTASDLTGRVDIYDPNNTITFDGTAVASIDGVTPAAGYDTGVAASPITLFTAAAIGMDGLAAFFLGMFVLILCVIGMFLMWLFSLLQQFLIAVAIGVSPIFLGLLLIRGLDGVASRFLTGFVGLVLWPLGWGIANLVTTLLESDGKISSRNGAGRKSKRSKIKRQRRRGWSALEEAELREYPAASCQ
jgi:hypothetical protein